MAAAAVAATADPNNYRLQAAAPLLKTPLSQAQQQAYTTAAYNAVAARAYNAAAAQAQAAQSQQPVGPPGFAVAGYAV